MYSWHSKHHVTIQFWKKKSETTMGQCSSRSFPAEAEARCPLGPYFGIASIVSLDVLPYIECGLACSQK